MYSSFASILGGVPWSSGLLPPGIVGVGSPRPRAFLRALLLCSAIWYVTQTGLLAAEGGPDRTDVFETESSFSPPIRAVAYGLVFLTVCVVSIAVPDAPLLLFVMSMPVDQLVGARVALTLLQCGLVFVRTLSVKTMVPSLPLSVFLLCATASASWAYDPHESLFPEMRGGVVDMLLVLPLLVATRALLRSRLTTTRRLLWSCCIGCIPGCCVIIHNALSGIRFIQDKEGYYRGLISPDIFSPILVVCGIFLLLCLSSSAEKLTARLFAGLLLPLISISILLTGIRSGWLALLFAAIVLLVRMRSFVAVGGALAVGALVVILGFSNATGLDLDNRLSERFSEQSMHTGEMRLEYWEVAAQGFVKRPVLGIGWGCFPVFAADNTVGKQAITHNIFLRILCELGFVGFGLFVAWMALTTTKLSGSSEGRLVRLLMIGVFTQGLFLDLFFCTYFYFFLGVCDGVPGDEPSLNADRLEIWNCALANPTIKAAL